MQDACMLLPQQKQALAEEAASYDAKMGSITEARRQIVTELQQVIHRLTRTC